MIIFTSFGHYKLNVLVFYKNINDTLVLTRYSVDVERIYCRGSLVEIRFKPYIYFVG